jgi:DNA-binding transcriptional regulator YiaG
MMSACKGDAEMTFADELKRIRQRSFLTQEAFAKEVNVSFSTVNRWESGKTKPNLIAMKSIKEFCNTNNVEYDKLEELWLSLGEEGKE